MYISLWIWPFVPGRGGVAEHNGISGSGKLLNFSSSRICALVGMLCLTSRRDWPMNIGANFWPSSPIVSISVKPGKLSETAEGTNVRCFFASGVRPSARTLKWPLVNRIAGLMRISSVHVKRLNPVRPRSSSKIRFARKSAREKSMSNSCTAQIRPCGHTRTNRTRVPDVMPCPWPELPAYDGKSSSKLDVECAQKVAFL